MTRALILLFVGLSFNAYACLLPVNGIAAAAMENGCSTPDEQPVRQFCDAFKTISVQSASEVYPAIDCHVICSQDTASLSPPLILASHSIHPYDHPADGPPQDLFLRIRVLRI
jgi:hypothetical protein